MLNFLCFFFFFFFFFFVVVVQCSENSQKITIAPYGENCYYLTYQDKIENLEGYIFEKCLTIKTFWNGPPVFTQ